jgi:hypothetical protein
MANAHVAYRAARDQLLDLSVNYSSALKTLEWPQLGESFNWAIAWFDQFAPVRARVRFKWVCSGVSWGAGCSSSRRGGRGGVAGWFRVL